ncbi:major facilitator superfamily MFS_1 [Pseudomonas putida S11]|nr:major facilitator superfamily MFS_1 [Pseudomonas putida S11]
MLVLAIALAEGAANDWLPLLMVDGHGYSGIVSSIVYAGFTAVMTIGRFAGSYFIERYGRDPVLRVCVGFAVAGVAGVVFFNHPAFAGLSALLWGFGVSIGFPIGISAAGDSPNDPEARVSIASTAAYFAFLVGPPMLGFLGQSFGLRLAMIPVLVMLAIVFFLVPVVRHRN